MTHLYRNFLLDEAFAEYDRVLVTAKCITSAYNNYLHSIWMPAVQVEDVSAKSSSEEQMDEEDDFEF